MGKLTDDILKLNIDINGSKAKKELAGLEQSTKNLQDANKSLRTEMQKLEAAGKKGTAEYKQLSDQIRANNKTIRSNKDAMGKLRKEIGITGLTTKQLRQEQTRLKRAMDNATPKSDLWNKYNKQLKAVQKRQAQISTGSNKAGKAMGFLKSALPIASVGALMGVLKSATVELFGLTRQMQGDAVRSATVFGNQLGFVQQEAAKVAKQMGLTNREYVANAAATADLLIPLDFSREASAKMSTELQKLTGALDEWTAGSIGAKGVSEILTKAMLGENEQLKQLGIAIRKDSEEFRELVKVKLKAKGVTKAQAEAMATLELITKKSADAQAAYNQEGNKLLRIQKSMRVMWQRIKENVVEWLSVSPVEELRNEQTEVNRLVVQLSDLNISEETRATLLDRLTKLAPDLAKSINNEKTDVNKLTKALESYNSQMALRILMKEQELKLEKQKDKQATYVQLTAEHEAEMVDAMNKSLEWFQKKSPEYKKLVEEVLVDSQKSTIEKAERIQRYAFDVSLLGNKNLGFAIRSYKTFRKRYAEESNLFNRMIKDAEALKERYKKIFGVKEENKEEENGGGSGGGGNSGGKKKPSDKEKDKAFTKATEALELAHKQRLNLIKKNYAEEQTTEAEFNAQNLAEEMIYLELKKAMYIKHGKDVTDIESQIYDMKIQARKNFNAFIEELDKEDLAQADAENEAEMERMAKNIEAQIDAEKIRIDKLNELHNEEMAMLQQKAALYTDFSLTVSSSIEEMVTVMSSQYDSAEEKQDALTKAFQNSWKNILFLTLDALKAQTELAVAGVTIQSLSSPESVATFGAAGLAKAAFLVGLIEAAFAVVKGSISGFGSKKEGGYGEIGYNNNEVKGFYHANEFIANAQATSNPSVRQVLDVIDVAQKSGTISTIDLPSAISGNLPGRKTGGYEGETMQASPSLSIPKEFYQMMQQNTAAINELRTNGVKGVWEYENYKNGRKKYEALESDVGFTQ